MKKVYLYSQICLLFFIATSNYSCGGQNETLKNNSTEKNVEDNNKITSYGEHDKVTSGILDKAGNLWFGTSNEGVYRYDGESFVNFTKSDGLSDNYINCIVEDRDGILWFGTRDGLNKYDALPAGRQGKSFTHVPVPWDGENNLWGDLCNPNVIQCMLNDRTGDLWIGTCGGGAYRYDGETFTNFSFNNDMKQADSLHHNVIQSMTEDTAGNIWFTSLTHGGVSRYDGKEVTHFSSSDGLKDDMVFSSFQDKTGNLWFGSIQTKYAGLYLYDGKTFTSFGKEDGLCDNFVTGFFEDKNGKLWIRTGSILCIYDGTTFSPFISEDGKNLSDINFILEDKEQNLWFGGRYGHLWKYDGKTLIDFTQKRKD